MEKQLSIIIINYNKEKYIQQCLDSIYLQSLQPNQIVIIDSCSTDSSLFIIQENAKLHKNILFIEEDKKTGIVSARNKGIELSTSDYLCFIDSDDFFVNNAALRNLLVLSGPKKASFGSFALSFENGRIKNNKFKKTPNFSREFLSLPKFLSEYQQISFPRNYVVSKMDVVGSGSFSEGCNDYNEDIDLLARLIIFGVVFVNTGTVNSVYRITNFGASFKNDSYHPISIKYLKNKYWDTMSSKERIFYHFYRFLKKCQKFFSFLINFPVRVVKKFCHK